MSKHGPRWTGWITALLVTAAAMPALGQTIAYWELDETDWEDVRRDSVGIHDMVGRGGWTTTAAWRADIQNPDPLVGGDNPVVSYKLHAHVPYYVEDFDMRDKQWTFEGYFDFREDQYDWETHPVQILAGTRLNGSYGKNGGWYISMYQGKLYILTTDENGNNHGFNTPNVIGGTGYNYMTTGIHHFALQWDPVNDYTPGSGDGTLRMYVDGQVILEGDGQGDLGAPDPTLGNPVGGDPFELTPQYKWFAVGHYRTPYAIDDGPTEGTAYNEFEGFLDELRFSRGILEPNQMLNYVPEPGSAVVLLVLGGLTALRRR